MNPIQFLQDNIFYTDEKTKQINAAQRQSALRPGQPGYNPERYFPATKPGDSVRDNAPPKQGPINLSDPAYSTGDRKTERQIAGEQQARRQSKVTNKDQTNFGAWGDSPRAAGDPYTPPVVEKSDPPTTGPAPDTTRTNPAGVVQKGRSLSNLGDFSLEEASAFAGTPIANFNGPSFPTQPATNRTTAAYPNTQGTGDPVRDSLSESERAALDAAGFITTGQLDGFKPGGEFAGPPTATEGQGDPNQQIGIGSATIAGGKNEGKTVNVNDDDYEAYRDGTKAVPAGKRQKLSDALGDKDGINSYMSKFRSNSPESQELRRRSTFLDGSADSMKATRMVNAGLGGIATNDGAMVNVDGKLQAMSAKDWRNYRNMSAEDAQGFKDQWVSSLKERTSASDTEPPKADQAQDPSVIDDDGNATNIDPEDRRVPGRNTELGGGF